MRKLRFYKNEDNRWYVDLPEWRGEISDLEMILGADLMLDFLSKGYDNLWLSMSTEFMENFLVLERIDNSSISGEGMYYIFKENENSSYAIWLCDVTKFVFGDFPEKSILMQN
jgi:hypothetical protein